MTEQNEAQFMIQAAEQVLDIFEKKYPSDKRPRKAIEAAKNYLKNPCKETKDAAAAAAYAYAYAYAAAAAAADADAYAYAYAAAADADADAVLRVKIIKYGLSLLE